jgi:MarR family transcriptional regulator, organic hydroperoxide resistance regulator
MSAAPSQRPVSAGRQAAVDAVSQALREVLAAERRLRGRDQQRREGLSFAQVRALFVLSGEDEMPAGKLAAAAELSPASVTQMLDHLEPAGIVERRRSAEDRRVVVVSLTAQGRKLLEAKRAVLQQRWREALAGFSDDELAAAAAILGHVRGLFEGL